MCIYIYIYICVCDLEDVVEDAAVRLVELHQREAP